MSVRALILAAMVARLSNIQHVYRSRTVAITAGKLPAIVVEPLSDEVTSRRVGGPDTRRLSVMVSVYAAGVMPDDAIEPRLQSVHAALAETSWRPSGVISVAEARTDWNYDEPEQVQCPCLYEIGYRE